MLIQTQQIGPQTDTSRLPVSQYEWALVGSVMLLYFHAVSLAIPAVPYVPLLVLGPAIISLNAIFVLGFFIPIVSHLWFYRPQYQRLVVLFTMSIAYMFILGILNDNGYSYLGPEMLFFLIFLLFLLIGGHDRTWYLIDRPATVTVYIGFGLMVLFKDTLASESIVGELAQNDRLTQTAAYGLRPLTTPAVFIFIWAAVNLRTMFWKILQFGTIAPFLVSEVGFFQFRSALATALYAFAAVFFVFPFFRGRSIHWTGYLFSALAIAGSVSYMIESESWERFTDRVNRANLSDASMFEVRNIEAELLFNKMGEEVFYGRGLGGTFDASSLFREEQSSHWRTLHYGFLSFVLRGGLVFLAIFIGFFLLAFRNGFGSWLVTPTNMATFLLLPLLVFQFATLPFLASLVFLPRYIWWALVFAMLGSKGTARQN